MPNECDTEDNAQNESFRKQMLDQHRHAFDIYLCLAQLMEAAVAKERNLHSSFAVALDLLFIMAFKSYQALYLLCVNGLGEDAATITRRLFEVALQVEFLSSDVTSREERGEQYIAHFWHNATEIAIAVNLSADRRKWWEDQYNLHKKRLRFDKNNRPAIFWFGSNFRKIAEDLGIENTYDADYRLLSNIAHCSARGFLMKMDGATAQINSDSFIEAVLVYGTKYTLCVAQRWNEHFALMDETTLEEIEGSAINFEFKKK
jgi:hypothetical protein